MDTPSWNANIILLYITSFLKNAQFFGAISIPFLLDKLQLDYFRIAMLELFFMVCIFVLEMPTGVVADKFGRKYSIISALLLSSLSIGLFGLADAYWVLFIAELLGAAGVAFLSGADQALLYDTLISAGRKKDGKHVLAKYDAFGTLGIIIAMPLGSFIVGHLEYPKGLSVAFYLTALAYASALMFIACINEPKRKSINEDWLQLGLKGIKGVWTSPKLRRLALNSSLISASTFFILWFYQPLSGFAGIPVAYYGFVAAGFNGVALLLLLNMRSIEKMWNMASLLWWTAIIAGLGLLVLAFVHQMFVVLVAICGVAVARFLRKPVLNDYINQRIKSVRRATTLSAVSMIERISIGAGYILVALLTDISLSLILVVLGVLTMIFAVMTRIRH